MLLVQRGKELGYTLSDEQFKSIVENIKKENKIETDEQFQAALKQESMTLADLRRKLERQMIVQRVQQNEVIGKIGVTEDEAQRLLRGAPGRVHDAADGDAARDPRRRCRATRKGVNVAADEAAQGEGRRDPQARAIGRRERSRSWRPRLSDSPSKANGGLIGPLSVDDLSPELQKLIEAMKPATSPSCCAPRAAIRS